MVMELGFIWSVEFNIKTEKRSLYGKQEAQFSIPQNLYIVRVLASDYTDFDIAVNLAQLKLQALNLFQSRYGSILVCAVSSSWATLRRNN